MVVLATTGHAQQSLGSNVDSIAHDVENKTSEEVQDKLKTLFHDSRNKLYLAFYNLSSFLPLDIEYAETVGKDCDVLEYNRDYYTTVGLVLGGLLALVGVIFAFFGRFSREREREGREGWREEERDGERGGWREKGGREGGRGEGKKGREGEGGREEREGERERGRGEGEREREGREGGREKFRLSL